MVTARDWHKSSKEVDNSREEDQPPAAYQGCSSKCHKTHRVDDSDTNSSEENQPPITPAVVEIPVDTASPVLDATSSTALVPTLQLQNPIAAPSTVETPVDTTASSTAVVPTLQLHPMPQVAPIPIDPALL